MPLLEASDKFLQHDSSTLQDGIFQSLPSYNPNQQKVFYDDNLYDGYNDWDQFDDFDKQVINNGNTFKP